MSVVDKALETQIRNIQTRTGKTLDDLHALIRASGLAKHGEIRDMLEVDLGMGHGDANTLVPRTSSPPRRHRPSVPLRRRTSSTRSTPKPRPTSGRSTTSS